MARRRLSRWSRWLLAGTLLAAPTVATAAPASASATTRPHARVLAERAEIHSGPGFSFRVIASLSRDDIVEMVERGKRGGWTRIRLDTGTTGWVLTEQVELFGLATTDEHPGPFRRFGRKLRDKVLGPPNLLSARIGGALSAGALGREGLFVVRPSVFLSPNAGLEAYLGPSVGRETSRGMFGLAANLYLSPSIPFTPFVSVGGGALLTRGKVDALGDARWTYLASPGGGVWIIFKHGIGIRFDFRNHISFRADDAQSLREYSGALAFSF